MADFQNGPAESSSWDTFDSRVLGAATAEKTLGLPFHFAKAWRCIIDPYMAFEISAPITGTVWKIPVSVGEPVGEGQTVVILESMKMEMPIEATESGKVSEILVSEGQSVEEGDVLVRCESA